MSTTAKERAEYVANEVRATIASQATANRLGRGWTKSELSERSGVSVATISKIEDFHERGLPDTRSLQKLAVAFDIAIVVRLVAFEQLAIQPFEEETNREP